MNDNTRSSGEDHNWKHDSGRRKSSDSEMLRTYSTGILGVCLAGYVWFSRCFIFIWVTCSFKNFGLMTCSGGQVVEDVLTSGLSAKLMRYLRVRALGETSTSQKDVSYLTESKLASTTTCIRGKEEVRSRFRQVSETSQLDAPRVVEEGYLDEHVTEKDPDINISRQACEPWIDGREPPDDLAEDDNYEADAEGGNRWHGLRDGKIKFLERNGQGRSLREEDLDDSVREDTSRRRANRGWAKSRGKGRVNEDAMENEHSLTSPRTGRGQERSTKDRGLIRNLDLVRVPDVKKCLETTGADSFAVERDDNDDCFQECRVGSKDISDLVKKAVRAAETEARGAAAPPEAIKAAGDSAAEVVKSAALEVSKPPFFLPSLF